MSTLQLSKVRQVLLSTVTLLSIGLPLGSVLHSNAAMAQQMMEQNGPRHRHHTMMPTTPTTPPPKPMAKTPTYMESFGFNYQYANHPIINGSPTNQSYLGTGFAPVGTYKPGQTINIFDTFGRPVGTYTIGSINNMVPYNAQQLNKVSVVEYDWQIGGAVPIRDTISNGLNAGAGGMNGLGSEAGFLSTGGRFTNQNLGVLAMHF